MSDRDAAASDSGRADDGRPDGESVRRRVLAYAVDAVVLGVPLLLGVGALDRSWLSRLSIAGVVGTIVGFLYHISLEGRYGRTPGKRALGLVVVRTDGTPCTYRAAAIRTTLRPVDWLPAGYLAGLSAIGLTERRQRLGDLLAGTLVVKEG